MSRQVDLTPERILHVGDDPINDYQGAIEAGLQAILLDSRRKWSSFSGRRVDTLAEVVPFLRLPV
jgi:putative hydrolase of the HAD superfamily